MKIELNKILSQSKTSELIDCPEKEKYITVSGHGAGVKERIITDGKTPVPFNGYRVKKGQLIYSRIGASDGAFGIVPEYLDQAVVSKDFPVFDVCSDLADIDYLIYYLTSDMFCQIAARDSFGATMTRYKEDKLLNCKIKLPSLDLQRTIVKSLDCLKRIIAFHKNELQMFDDLIKSRFVEIFGDPRKNPHNYEKKALKDTCTVVTGNTPSRTIPEYYGDYIEWIKTDNIISGRLYPTKAVEYLSEEGILVGKAVEKGSILMACIAGSVASIGKVCITDRKVAFNQQINAVVPKAYDALFLYVMLQLSKEYLVEEINMALKGILSKSKLEAKEFIIPPLELQKDFAAFVSQVDKSKADVTESLESAQLLFDSLMQKYFSEEESEYGN